MTYPGSKIYYSDSAIPPDSWNLESGVFKLSLFDSMLDRSRLLTFSVSNPYNTVEVLNRFFRYQRIQVLDRVSGIRIFLGRVEKIEPKYSEESGQYLDITCRDYIQEFFERTVNTNYTPAQKRSAIVSSIITNYRYGTTIQQEIEASGSAETVTRDFSNSDIRCVEAIENLALEDKWDPTPTGYGYDYYMDDEPRFWYFKRGTKPTTNASTGGMIISLGSSSQSPRVKHMLSDYIFPVNPIETITRVTVYGKSAGGATISFTNTNAVLEATLGIRKELTVTDVTLKYDTDANALAAGEPGNSCEARAAALAAYYNGNVTRALIKIPNYPVYSMASEPNSAAKLGHTIVPDGAISIWNFDESSGSLAADSYGVNHLTLANGSWVLGRVNYSYSFNGATTTATNVVATGLPTSTITVAAWVYVTSLVNWNVIIEHDKGNNGGWNLNIDNTGAVNFTIRDGAGVDRTASLAGISINTWYRVVGTYDGTNIYVYIDGTSSAATAAAAIVLDSAGDIHVGHDGGAGNWFNGYIDEVSLFNISLSSLQENFKTATQNTFRLVPRTSSGNGLWRFEDNSGSTAIDSLGSNSMALTSTTWTTGTRGYALSFDGTNSYGTVTNIAAMNTASFSASLWFNADQNRAQGILDKWGVSGWRIFMVDVTGVIEFDAVGEIANQQTGVTTVGTWNHIVVTYNSESQTVSIYLNGILSSSVGGIASMGNTTANNIIVAPTHTNRFDGTIDEVAFYTSALTASQVRDLYVLECSFLPLDLTGYRGAFLGGTGWELLRAGHIVRVINYLKGIDEDFLVLGISYVEPESIAELELLSKDRGRSVFGYTVSKILADIKGKSAQLMTRILQT